MSYHAMMHVVICCFLCSVLCNGLQVATILPYVQREVCFTNVLHGSAATARIYWFLSNRVVLTPSRPCLSPCPPFSGKRNTRRRNEKWQRRSRCSLVGVSLLMPISCEAFTAFRFALPLRHNDHENTLYDALLVRSRRRDRVAVVVCVSFCSALQSTRPTFRLRICLNCGYARMLWVQ